MPTYTYNCPSCGSTIEQFRAMKERDDVTECGKCEAKMRRGIDLPHISPDQDDFHTENGGKGRFNKQLNCHVTSVNDAINKAKQKGMYVIAR